MKITLDIDPNKISDSINDIMKTLDQEQKKDLAKQVLIEWLNEPVGIESQIVFKEAYEKTKSSLQQRDCYRSYLEKDALSGYEFNSNVLKTLTSKEHMIASIRCEIMQYYREQVKELVRNDPCVKSQLDETAKHIAEDFPKLVKNAMSQWFIQNLGNMQENIQALISEKEERERERSN